LTPSVIVSLHDVAPSTAQATLEWLGHLEQRQVPATLLVVTGAWQGAALQQDHRLVDHLHRAVQRGHEVAFHGVDHIAVAPQRRRDHTRAVTGRLLARGCAEFAALDRSEATRRLTTGLVELRRLGFDVTGFTPPGWLMSPGTLEALEHSGLRYATTQWHIRELSTWRRLRIPALSHRPDSPLTGAAAQAFLNVGLRRLGLGRTTRIALHPRDLDDRRLLGTSLELIDRALAQGARFTTYTSLVHRWVSRARAEAVA
jgi:predicted deacetylase